MIFFILSLNKKGIKIVKNSKHKYSRGTVLIDNPIGNEYGDYK